jgi:ubiquinone/menaquinone biosynthesis C-methylase UbiE
VKKISTPFIINQYESGVESYKNNTIKIGLWESERYIFSKYLSRKDQILDMGCGTGRTTFALDGMGFKNIIGVDLTPSMIREALQLNDYYATTIDFREGDACSLDFLNEQLNVVIFSFNGLMSIPSFPLRTQALQEINRVLKPNGYFIFTTHDRDREPQYFSFWEEEKIKWASGNHDQLLYEFGDLITFSKNESRKIYIHIPNYKEIEEWVLANGFNPKCPLGFVGRVIYMIRSVTSPTRHSELW